MGFFCLISESFKFHFLFLFISFPTLQDNITLTSGFKINNK